MKFSDVVPAFKRYMLQEKNVTVGSYKSIVHIMERLIEFSGTEHFKSMNTNVIREFLLEEQKKKDWKPSTFRNNRQYIKSFYDWCVREQYVKNNPVEKIEKPKLPKHAPRYITKEEAQQILACCHFYNWTYPFERIRNEAILCTFLMTGVRLSELLNIKSTDVNIDEMEIFIRMGKGSKDRIVSWFLPNYFPYFGIIFGNENDCFHLPCGFLPEYTLIKNSTQKIYGESAQKLGRNVASSSRLTCSVTLLVG